MSELRVSYPVSVADFWKLVDQIKSLRAENEWLRAENGTLNTLVDDLQWTLYTYEEQQ